MNIEEIKTGADLRQYTLELLAKKDQKIATGEYTYPTLLDYLLSLWTVAEQYKENELLTFQLIAKILEQAFIAPKKQLDWKELEKEPYVLPYDSKPNTPEFHNEVKKYPYFEKSIRNHVISLKMLLTYGAEKLEVKPYDNIFTGNQYFWENTNTEKFLERGSYYLDGEDDWLDEDDKLPITWFTLCSILNYGRFEE
ncbi:hypothetical protein [Apibacter adventoris]|uniref:hypothetical protein n=1 Tax=Apibacter adventoris TaxID=1679466 RepID=UPI000CF6E839|nr:hypothetical protein [Apibacter adventoris]PQL92578.1 hypothetical protein C4S76_10930 [Apibacter adventoris]